MLTKGKGLGPGLGPVLGLGLGIGPELLGIENIALVLALYTP